MKENQNRGRMEERRGGEGWGIDGGKKMCDRRREHGRKGNLRGEMSSNK